MRNLSSLGLWVAALGMVVVTSGCFRAWDDYDPQANDSAGTGSAALCGGVGVLTDDFEDSFIDDRFWSDEEGAISEQGGELVFALPDGTAGSGCPRFGSEHAYDLTGRALGFELRALPAPPAEVTFLAWLRGPAGNSLELTLDNENASFGKTVNEESQTLASQRYAPAEHRFFRFREGDGTVYWETSGDGQSWVERAKADVASLFDVRYVSLELAGSGNGAGATAEIRIDNLDGGEVEGMCSMSTFSDDFDDGARSDAWTVDSCLDGCAMSESNGDLAFILDAGTPGSCSYTTASAYDLRGSTVSIELTAPPEPSSEGQLVFQVLRNSGNNLQFRIKHGELYCVQALDGEGGGDLAYTQFSAVDHRWLRFREQDGTIHFETSADGVGWHPQTSSIEPFGVDAVQVRIEASAVSELLAPLELRVDNVNLTP